MSRQLALALALIAMLTRGAHAKPHRAPRAKPQTSERAIVACIDERTGPDGGIPVREAIKLCTGLAKHDERIAKAVDRVHRAIEQCEQTVVDACYASAGAELGCEDDAIRARGEFAACMGGK